MHPIRWFAPGLLLALQGSIAAGTTIDFEEPEIESAHQVTDIPYVVNGVAFSTAPMALYREDAFPGCANPENQWLWGGQNGWFQPTIWAHFPPSPADPVHVVTVEMGTRQKTFLGVTLVLELYDASDQLVGSSALQPVADACWLVRGILTAVSPVPVDYALVHASEYYLDCIGDYPLDRAGGGPCGSTISPTRPGRCPSMRSAGGESRRSTAEAAPCSLFARDSRARLAS